MVRTWGVVISMVKIDRLPRRRWSTLANEEWERVTLSDWVACISLSWTLNRQSRTIALSPFAESASGFGMTVWGTGQASAAKGNGSRRPPLQRQGRAQDAVPPLWEGVVGRRGDAFRRH